jgi:hypothetical protein
VAVTQRPPVTERGSTVAQSIEVTLQEFAVQVEAAEQEKEQGKEYRSLLNKLTGAQEAAESLFWLTSIAEDQQGQEDNRQALMALSASLGHVLTTASVGTADRSIGEKLAARVRGIVEAELLDDDKTARDLIDRWSATSTKGKGSHRTDGPGTPDLGFKVVVTSDGAQVASTSKDNLNSLRDQLRKHHESKHGQKFGRGDEVHTQVTAALDAVMHKGEQQSTSGPYTVTREAVSGKATLTSNAA